MIKLPERFRRKIDQSDQLMEMDWAKIRNNFSQIYSDNNLFFFNEYTDHGYRHINSVLLAINQLIPAETWKLITQNEVAVLILSTFLHDLGMHLQPLTFQSFISGEYDDLPDYGFHDEKWTILWDNYLEEAKKWTEEEQYNILGTSEANVANLKFDDINNLDGNCKKIIGEFIRRHHPRIAFEVAFKGLKTNSNTFLDLCSGANEDVRFIAGLIARSHGMHVRETFPILQKKYLDIWKVPRRINCIFLMILLRLGDYLQVDEKRVLKVPYQTKLFKSPVSIFEHKKHFAILEFQELTEDAETIYFDTSPPNSIMFVALKDLFNSIQAEFDISWAIIGELYNNDHKKFSLKYRRIKSNLNDNNYIEQLKYIPKLISFTADKELLKLLIAPLYGNHPSFGIRELLQNSIDACHELGQSQQGNYAPEIRITFSLNDEKKTVFSIEDNGKGMTLMEIEEHFLRAGSSLRKSKEWQQAYKKIGRAPTIH